MTRFEYSSMCLSPENYLEKVRSAKTFVENQGFKFGVQLHNSIDPSFMMQLLQLKGEIEFSIHSPLQSEYFLNLASSDYESTRAIVDKCTEYLPQFQTDILFFHGFFMTDTPIVHDMKNYRKTIQKSIGDQFCLNKSFIMDPVFFKTETFDYYLNNFRNNYKKIKNDFPVFTIAQENDFVGIGSGLQRPEEIHDLIDNLWFDLGHFWCSSLLHKFDFHEESYRIIETKNIVGVHINHNLTKHSSPLEQIRDSHTHFYYESEMNLAPIVKKLVERNVGIITLEIVDGDINDLKTLFNWL